MAGQGMVNGSARTCGRIVGCERRLSQGGRARRVEKTCGYGYGSWMVIGCGCAERKRAWGMAKHGAACGGSEKTRGDVVAYGFGCVPE